jgi:hypothetical protein
MGYIGKMLSVLGRNVPRFVEQDGVGFMAKGSAGGSTSGGSGTLPSVPLPKAPKGGVTVPSYRTTVEATTSPLRRVDRDLANTDRLAARSLGDTRKVIRNLVKASPDLSGAVSFLLRTGIPERYTMVSRNMDGTINPEATGLAAELLRRMTYLGNADGSMGVQQGLQSLSEQLGLELILDGAACLEVALDKARVPASMNAVSVTTLVMYDEENSFKLMQKIGGVLIDLDVPTIIYTTVDNLLTEAYPSSYIEAAIQPTLADADFNNDVRRALKRAVLPRMTATIDSEKVKKMVPPDILADPDKFIAYKNSLITGIQDVVNQLNPEDALVSYDSVAYAFVDGGHDPSGIIERLQKVLNGKLAAGAKTLPVILGHGTTSNASSAESLLYIKQANMLRVKLNEIYSRALTVAVRVLGQDCYVEFNYADIELKPESELEAFKSMKQSRVLELLSVGLISDEEASIMLTGNLPPAGYKPLMGTMFKTAASAPIGNPASNTSAMDKTLTPGTPKSPKSPKAP